MFVPTIAELFCQSGNHMVLFLDMFDQKWESERTRPTSIDNTASHSGVSALETVGNQGEDYWIFSPFLVCFFISIIFYCRFF